MGGDVELVCVFLKSYTRRRWELFGVHVVAAATDQAAAMGTQDGGFGMFKYVSFPTPTPYCPPRPISLSFDGWPDVRK